MLSRSEGRQFCRADRAWRLSVWRNSCRLFPPTCRLGRDVKLFAFVNLYGCSIGDESKIGTFVEIQKNATIGARCKISSHTFICEGVTIEDDCFIGHHVCFTNDLFPRATAGDGRLQTEADWQVIPTRVCRAHPSARVR